MITVTDLTKVYYQAAREVRALDGVSLSVPEGSIHGIIGHSGAGKSTLVRCLALLDRPTSGTVEINGVDLTASHSYALRAARRRIGLVFQQANLFDSRTIIDNVAYPLELLGRSRTWRHAKAAELLALVGLGDALHAWPAQLSGGMRQRVGIARALATDPDVLLLDEPTSALDPKTTDEILDLIAHLDGRENLSVLVITHEMHVIKRICDAVSLLEDGRIVESGALAQVVTRLDGRLSEALLGIPPYEERHDGSVLVDVLSSGERASRPVVAHVSQSVGAEIAIVAGSIEHLAGTTFAHLRLAVPEHVSPRRVVDELRALGTDAALTTELEATR